MKSKLLMIALILGISWTASAQSPYRTAGGLFIDVGDGFSLVGPKIKHFFSGSDAIAGSVLFRDNYTTLGAEYSYNQKFTGTNNLYWNIGVGPQLSFVHDNTYLAIRPLLGLEFKIPTAPLAFGFDWRPRWNVSNGSNFTAGRFGIGFKYVFN